MLLKSFSMLDHPICSTTKPVRDPSRAAHIERSKLRLVQVDAEKLVGREHHPGGLIRTSVLSG
jgi:hypothetical protein